MRRVSNRRLGAMTAIGVLRRASPMTVDGGAPARRARE